MRYFFNISVCLCLVLLQTTVMPYLPLLDSFYDLLIPLIVFLGLYRPVRVLRGSQSHRWSNIAVERLEIQIRACNRHCDRRATYRG